MNTNAAKLLKKYAATLGGYQSDKFSQAAKDAFVDGVYRDWKAKYKSVDHKTRGLIRAYIKRVLDKRSR
jgi:hypothetical protein